MKLLTTLNSNAILHKTDQGREAMIARGPALTIRQRRVLIMADGIKTVGDLLAIPALHEVAEIVAFLQKNGYIVLRDPAMAKAGNGATAEIAVNVIPMQGFHPKPVSHLTQDLQTIREVKDFLTTTAQTYLGLLAADVIRRIERADNAEQLMSLLGHWHMALRESKQGNRFAASYLEQVKASLTDSQYARADVAA